MYFRQIIQIKRRSRLTFPWDVMSCSLARTHQCFRGITCLHRGQYCGVLEVYQMFCLQGHDTTGKNDRLYRLLSEGSHWDVAAPQITLKICGIPSKPSIVPSHRHDKRVQRRQKPWGMTNDKVNYDDCPVLLMQSTMGKDTTDWLTDLLTDLVQCLNSDMLQQPAAYSVHKYGMQTWHWSHQPLVIWSLFDSTLIWLIAWEHFIENTTPKSSLHFLFPNISVFYV
jgi:hypothetical protein